MAMTIVQRVRRRYRIARSQRPALRWPYLLAPVHRRSAFILHRRLRALGAADPAALLTELDGVHAAVRAAEAEYVALAPAPVLALGGIDPVEGALLYGAVRARRPDLVFETGTASGISTTYLLAALARNGHGRLVSIDLPFAAGEDDLPRAILPATSIDRHDASLLPPGKDPGWAVPHELRDRWELRLGDARELLPTLLAEVGEVELFFHDSLHTREHMLFEFETVWPHLARGGLLVADDIFQRKHDALPVFARSIGRPFDTFGNLGFVEKR